MKFISFDDTSFSYSTCYNIEDHLSCSYDTIGGILFLAKKLKYTWKNEYTCHPTYLYFSTDFKGKKSELDPPKYSSYRGIGMKNLPTEMLKLYYIQSLYEKSFVFKSMVVLGYKKNDLTIEACKAKHNRKILKKAEKSLQKWVDMLERNGLEYMRQNNINPLFYSELEWKG